jgi:hypothetical protein
MCVAELCGMQALPDASPFIAFSEDEVLSPESYVYVALMSVEEGPNKASFLRLFQPVVSALEAIDSVLCPVPGT